MKKTLTAAVGILAAFSLVFGLSGCSNVASSKKPVAMSKAFKSKQIWYIGDKPSKNGEISVILVFDGKGKVTRYNVGGFDEDDTFTYGDLDGLSDKKIIKKAKERDKEYFDEYVKTMIEELDDFSKSQTEYFEEEYDMTVSEAIEKLEAAKYQEPKAQPYELKIVTNKSGSKAKKEILSYTYYYLDSDPESDTFGEYTTPDDDIQWTVEKDNTDIKSRTVKGKKKTMYFNGFEKESYDGEKYGLYMKVKNDKHGGFVLDEPGTKGVEETDEDEEDSASEE